MTFLWPTLLRESGPVDPGRGFEVSSDSEFGCLWFKNVEMQPVVLFLLLRLQKIYVTGTQYVSSDLWEHTRKGCLTPPSPLPCISNPWPRHAFSETGCVITIRTMDGLQQQQHKYCEKFGVLVGNLISSFLEDCLRSACLLSQCGNIPNRVFGDRHLMTHFYNIMSHCLLKGG